MSADTRSDRSSWRPPPSAQASSSSGTCAPLNWPAKRTTRRSTSWTTPIQQSTVASSEARPEPTRAGRDTATTCAHMNAFTCAAHAAGTTRLHGHDGPSTSLNTVGDRPVVPHRHECGTRCAPRDSPCRRERWPCRESSRRVWYATCAQRSLVSGTITVRNLLRIGVFVWRARRAPAVPRWRLRTWCPGRSRPGPSAFNVVTIVGSISDGDIAFDPSLPVEDGHATVGASGRRIQPHPGRLPGASPASACARALRAWPCRRHPARGVPGDIEGWPRRSVDARRHQPVRRSGDDAAAVRRLSPDDRARREPHRGCARRSVRFRAGHQHRHEPLVASSRRPGSSRTRGRWTFEADVGAVFFTDNTDFRDGGTYEQAPILSTQGHLIYTIRPGFWVAGDGNFWRGGRVTTNGVRGHGAPAELPTRRDAGGTDPAAAVEDRVQLRRVYQDRRRLLVARRVVFLRLAWAPVTRTRR